MSMSPELKAARDQAIELTVNTATYEHFMSFCIENDIAVPVACPRERMALVIYLYILNCPPNDARAQKIKTEAIEVLEKERGFTISEDGRALINTREDNRRVLVPPGLCFFPEEGVNDGTGTNGVVQGRSSVDSPSTGATGDLQGTVGGVQPSREQSTPLPIRRKSR